MKKNKTLNTIIKVVCINCGKKYDRKNKKTMGIWMDDCDMCGKKKIPCADAAHDFGIYSSEKIRKQDRLNDLI